MELSRTLRPGSPVLDLGCGGGRHLIVLAGDGHTVSGMDISRRGLEHCREWLQSEGLEADLIRLSKPPSHVHFRLRCGAHDQDHQPRNPGGHPGVFEEITRITRPGGHFVGSVISSEDARYGDGEQIAEHTFVHDRPPEDGVPHHYFTESSVRGHLRGFSTVDLFLSQRVVSPEDPIFGQYRFREGVTPVLRHWSFRAIK